MRVSHVITRLIVGGAQENTITTAVGLQERGVEVDLVAGPTHGAEGSLEQSVPPSVPLNIEPHLVRPVHPLQDVLAYRNLIRRFRRSQPDIVHTHSGKAGIIGRLAAHKAGVPLIIHTIHGPSFGPFQGALPNLIFRTAEQRAGKVTRHFSCVANAMSDQYLAAGIGSPANYTTIRSGFDLNPYLESRNDLQLRKSLGIPKDAFVVGKIARLFKLKGHDDLFVAAADVVRAAPNARFLLVGDGPWRERFQQELTVRNLAPYFVFTGLVPPSEVSRYVGIMDCLVHLSVREGLPRALPQAMAGGKPVIAYDCDGAREVCMEQQTGYLLAPGDRVGLTRALSELARSEELRLQLGHNGRRLAREQFDQQTMVDDTLKLYRKLMPEHAP